MTPITTLVRVEIVKLLRRPMTWTLSIILMALTGFVYASMIVALLAPESAGVDTESLKEQILLPDGLFFAATIAGSLTTIMIIILAAGSVGGEFSWATIRSNLMMGATRTRFLVAKLLALELFALVWYILTAALGVLGAIVTAAATSSPVGSDYLLSTSFVTDTGRILLHALIVLAVWTLIATAITVITGSLAAGIGVTLAVVMLGSQIAGLIAQIGSIGKWASRVIPNKALDAITSLDAATPPKYLATDWIWIVASIVGWSAIFAFLAVRRFRAMNLIGNS